MRSFDDIHVRSHPVGRDLLIIISGGEAHIGAASTGYYDYVLDLVHVQTSIVPDHKEHLLSEHMARQAAEALHRTVTIVMGIHYDRLSKEEIEEVSGIAQYKFQEHLNQLLIGSE